MEAGVRRTSESSATPARTGRYAPVVPDGSGPWEALGAAVATTVAVQDLAHLLSLVIPMWGAVLRLIGPALVFSRRLPSPLGVAACRWRVWDGHFAPGVR